MNMLKNRGLVEYWAISAARYIKSNGGHQDVSVGTMRFALQLWISLFMTVLLSTVCGLLLGTAPQTLSVLAMIGVLRYFSGGWHFRSLDVCILFTGAVAVVVPHFPVINENWLAAMNGISLILVLLLAPTGHGQKFKSEAQRTAFKWTAVTLVLLNFISLFQISTICFMCQSLTLITMKGGDSKNGT